MERALHLGRRSLGGGLCGAPLSGHTRQAGPVSSQARKPAFPVPIVAVLPPDRAVPRLPTGVVCVQMGLGAGKLGANGRRFRFGGRRAPAWSGTTGTGAVARRTDPIVVLL